MDKKDFWKNWVNEFYESNEGKKLKKDLLQLSKKGIKTVPSNKDAFRAFRSDISKTKVVIVGQDPYPSGGHANGLAFASNQSKTPLSLKILFDIIKYAYPDAEFKSNDLQCWADQGVLLLNTAFTVIEHKPGSLTELWSEFTNQVIQKIYETNPSMVWITFGKPAYNIVKSNVLFDSNVFHCYHPAYISRAQIKPENLQQNVFSQANMRLRELKLETINWSTK